ncbi:MAG: hypothetical protein HRU17_21105 [Polyangiaceae bacterium]|nr:hypothetical protein [Polyangiaceae bacterium]
MKTSLSSSHYQNLAVACIYTCAMKHFDTGDLERFANEIAACMEKQDNAG